MRPTGFRSFTCTPRVPKEWPGMALEKIHAFGNIFDLSIKRVGNTLEVQVLAGGKAFRSSTIDEGATATFHLDR